MSEPSFVLEDHLGLLAATGPKGNREFGDHWPRVGSDHSSTSPSTPWFRLQPRLVASAGWPPAWRYGLYRFVAALACRCTLNGAAWSARIAPIATDWGSHRKRWYLLGAPMVWVGVQGWVKKPKLLAFMGILAVAIALVAGPDLSSSDGGSDPRHIPSFPRASYHPVLGLPLGMQSFALPLAVAVGTMGLTGLYLHCPNQDATKTMVSQGTDGICSLLDACCTSQRGARV